MKTFLEEFKKFALKGNVIDMAIGVVIGSAFSKITSSLVNDVIMPFFAMLLGDVNFTEMKLVIKETVAADGAVTQVTVNYGQFIQNVVDFVLIAFVLFMVVKFMNSLKKKEEAAPAPAPAPVKSDETVLLEEIRDLLKNK